MYLEIIAEGRIRHQKAAMSVYFTGSDRLSMPLDYEQTEALIERVYAFLKDSNTRDPQITVCKEPTSDEERSGAKPYSIGRIYFYSCANKTGTVNIIYWPRMNVTEPHEEIPLNKKTVKEFLLYCLKFERDPAE